VPLLDISTTRAAGAEVSYEELEAALAEADSVAAELSSTAADEDDE
jgi:hypothetical protein